MNATQRGVLIGMLWGDGCIKHKTHACLDGSVSHYYEFVAGHSSKQEQYITYKRDIFHSLIGGKKPLIHRRKFFLNGVEHEELRFGRQDKYFSTLYHWVYPFGKKTYTRRILDYVNAAGLSFWYMDDGGISKSKRPDGSISSCEMRLATYCPEDQADIIISYFKEVWNLVAKKRHHKKTNSWYIVFNTTESKKLEEIIRPFMHDSMLYKLPSNWITRVQST
jgi:hypothetical protein